MINRFLSALLVAVLFLASCDRDPNVAKKRYVDNGNKYFQNGKYKEALIMYRKALQRDLKYGEAYYRAALAGIKLQRFGEAVRDLRRAVELQPENLDAISQLTNIYLAAYSQDPKKSPAILNELQTLHQTYEKRFPNSYEEARLAGYMAMFSKDIEKARVSFERANKLKPYQPDLVLMYMQVLGATNRVEEALQLARETVAKDPKAIQVYDALIAYHARKGESAEVLRLITEKIQKNPASVPARLQLATHHLVQKDRDGMLKVLNDMANDKATFPSGHLHAGDFLMRIRQAELAGEHYRKGLQSDEKNKSAYNKRLVEVLLAQKKKDDAVALVNQILKDDPKDNEAIAMRASLSLMTGTKEQLQSAINDLQTVISRMPQNFVVRYNLGRALLAQQNVQAAKVQFEEALKLRGDYSPARLALAQLSLVSGEYGKADQMAQEVLNQEPGNAGAQLVRSRALLGMGQTKQARVELAKTTEQFPNLPEARLQMAALDVQDRNFKAAEDAFRKLYSQTADPRALLGLVDSLVGQGQHPAAIKLMKEEVARNPNRPEYQLALAHLHTQVADYNGAITEYKNALAKNPQNPQAWLYLGEVHRRAGDSNSAFEAVKKAQQLAPNTVAPHVQLALMYESYGRRHEATPIYEQILKLQPGNVMAMNNLAYTLAENGSDLDRALTLAQRARQMLPNNPDVADTLGWIYIKKNLPDSAVPIFRELTQKQPERATYHYHLAMAFFQKGDKTSAKRSAEQALNKKPSRDEEAKIRELMSKLG